MQTLGFSCYRYVTERWGGGVCAAAHARRETALQHLSSPEKGHFWTQCVELVTTGGAGQYIENIAVLFTADAKAGKYDSLTDEEYSSLLAEEYSGLVRMVDFSRFSAEGWNGSLHLRDIFDGVNADAIKQRGLIVVLDEADKILCEHAVGGSGTDHNALLQNDLLKMMDGDVIEFGEESKKSAMSIDCSKVSVIMLGAFERLLEGKTQDAKHIGFGSAPKADAGKHKDISYDDLINAGMRLEVAGRINKIVALDPLTIDDYKSILIGPVLSGLQQSLGCRIHIDSAAAGLLAEQAAATDLGVRWMKSALQNAMDDAMFDAPEVKEWSITVRDGGLRCRPRTTHEAAPIGKRAANTAPDRLMSA